MSERLAGSEMALKRLLEACKLDRDLLGFNSSDRFSGRIFAEYVGVCSTAGMSQLETAWPNLHQRQLTARSGLSGFLEFDNWFEATEDKTFAIERHGILLHIHPFVLEIFRHHLFHGGIACFLVRPLDPGEYD